MTATTRLKIIVSKQILIKQNNKMNVSSIRSLFGIFLIAGFSCILIEFIL